MLVGLPFAVTITGVPATSVPEIEARRLIWTSRVDMFPKRETQLLEGHVTHLLHKPYICVFQRHLCRTCLAIYYPKGNAYTCKQAQLSV